jgi:hypothetical protein
MMRRNLVINANVEQVVYRMDIDSNELINSERLDNN